MYKKVLSLCLLTFAFFASKAVYRPMAVTGFNHDIVANGQNVAVSSVTTADVDGVNYNFMELGYRNPSGTASTSGLPSSRIINSAVAATSGLQYRLADYSSNNALRIPATGSGTGSGTLTFLTPVKATTVYVLATTGSASSTSTYTINFEDGTSQTSGSISVPDWYGGANFAIQGIGRVNRSNNNIENSTTDPRLYQITVNVDAGNQNKRIVSVTINKTSAAGVLNVMGVSVNTTLAPTCAEATNLTASSILGVSASFTWTAASPAPTNYYWKLVEGEVPVTAAAVAENVVPGGNNNLTILNLTPNTKYTLYFRSVCGTNELDSSLHYWPFTFSTICAGPPSAGGTAASTMSAACATETFTLSVTGNSSGQFTYQWQQSTNSGTTWNDIAGANSLTWNVTGLAASTMYRLQQSCAADPSNYVYSVPVTVNTRACYCNPSYGTYSTGYRVRDINIPSVGFSHSPTYNVPNYTNLSFTVTGIDPVPVTAVTVGWTSLGVAIDFNNDGDFNDADEIVALPPYIANDPATVNFTFSIPPYVLSGNYRIRFYSRLANSGDGNPVASPCGTYTRGTWHDYTINIINNASCQPPSNINISNLTATGARINWNAPATTTPVQYQWKVVAGGGTNESPALQTGVVPSSVFLANVSGLTQSTDYTVFVRSICGTAEGDTSYWSAAVHFTTLCGSAPTQGGTTQTTAASACATEAFTLSTTGASTGNYEYQWQSNTTGTWVDIVGQNGATATMSGVSVNTQYRRKQYCVSFPSQIVYSSPVTVSFRPCYCNPSQSSGCNGGAIINNVYTSGADINISNMGTGCNNGNGGYYTYFSNHMLQTLVGTQVTFNVTVTSWAAYVRIWIDWNQNGVFEDATELIGASGNITAGNTYTVNYTVPMNALGGQTRMRVRAIESTTSYNSCNSYSWGESEDYVVNVLANTSCIAPRNFTFPNIGPYTATINWDAPATTTPLQYQWKLVTSGSPSSAPAIQSGVQNASIRSVIVTGLVPNTPYTLYVRSICDASLTPDDTSYWSSAVNFTTICATTPVPGSTITSSATVSCPSETINLSLTGNTVANGISYQWQSSTDNGTTWTNIASQTNATASINNIGVTTLYRAAQFCAAEPANVVYSNPVQVEKLTCYCRPTFTSGCSTWRITNFTLGAIDNSPSVCTNWDYTSMSATVPVGVGLTFSVTSNQYCGHSIYLDINGDGDYNDADELLFAGAYQNVATATDNATFVVPGYLPSGSYRLRVMAVWGGAPQAGQSCNTFQYGNFHDYTINVINPYTCILPSNITISNITSSGARISWTPPATGADAYEYVVVAQGGSPADPPFASGTTTSTSVDINTLLPLFSYSVYVRSHCGTSDMSIWNNPAVDFTTICAGPPVPGTTQSSMASACNTETFTLSVTGNTTSSSLEYQWQSSTDGGTTWNNIAGATALTRDVTGMAVSTQYRLRQACQADPSNYTYSAPVTVNSRACYCTITGSFLSGYRISSFQIPSIGFNFTPTYNVNNYLSTIIDVQAGSAVPVTLVSTGWTSVGLAVDFNNNGLFTDAGERVLPDYIANDPATYNIVLNVPATAQTGTYRLRVWTRQANAGGANEGVEPCGAYTRACYHDFTLRVTNNLPPCTTPVAQPTNLTFSNVTSTSLTGTFTAAAGADNYLVVRTANNAVLNTIPMDNTNYTLGSPLGNGTIVSNGSTTTFNDNGLQAGVIYRYTIFAQNATCINGPKYLATDPLINIIQTNAVNIYHWNGAPGNTLGTTDFQTASNWVPERTNLDITDELWFDNSRTDNIVTNIPTQTVGRLRFLNNTTATWRPSTGVTFTMNSDNDSTTSELDVQAGSSFISNATGALITYRFGGTGAKATVAGTLEASNTTNNTNYNVFDMSNGMYIVEPAGKIVSFGNTGNASFTNTAVTNFLVNGTYEHKYTTNSGPAIPTASWNDGSTVLVSGYTTATGGPNGGMNQSFFNFTYNCPNQTTNTNWSGTGPLTARGTFSMISTGTGTLQFASTQVYNYVVNNYVQTGGTLTLGTGVPASNVGQTLHISGTFNQTGGVLQATGTNTSATNKIYLNFNGTTGVQNVNFNNTAALGTVNYRISNNSGINLTGSGSLTTNFNINNNGGVFITSLAANPINTSLSLVYSTTNTLLTYDAPGNITATASVWPATSAPLNVTVNLGGGVRAVTVPFSRTIGGTLNMTSGDISLGANTLTLGTAANAVGTLTYSSGFIRLTTGSFARWYGTSGLPTSVGTGVGFYPIASEGGLNRNVQLAFSSATALSTGGILAVSHNNTPGLTNVTVADGAYTIGSRTNASWSIANTGAVISGSATITTRITEVGLFTSPDVANVRVMRAAAVTGNHAAGGGTFYANRSGITLANLVAEPLYLGSAAANMVGTYTAITTGNWTNPAIWDIGVVPASTNDAYINPNVTVTVNGVASAKSLTLNANATLQSSANTLTIAETLLNNGTVNLSGAGNIIVNGTSASTGITNILGASVNVSGGTLQLGASGGSNRPFINNGTLNVTGGTININGNLALNANSTFAQSGGNINVDGNAAGVVANSVANGTPLVNILTQNVNLTGGTFTIVDPHAGTGGTNTFVYNLANLHVNASGTHTFRFGDGTSTDAAGNASYAFSVNAAVSSGRFNFNNVIIDNNGGTNRHIVLGSGNTTGILGDVTINNNAELRFTAGNTLYVNKNVTVNTGGTFTMSSGTLALSNFTDAVVSPSANAQIFTINGTMRNATTGTGTANVINMQINNSHVNGITLVGNDLSFSGTLTFLNGIFNTGANKLIQIPAASNTGSGQSTGWVVGNYQRNLNTGAVSSFTFPVGTVSNYAPLGITSGTVTTAGGILARVNNGDAANIATSDITANRSVNQNWVLSSVNGLVAGGSFGMQFGWNTPALDQFANTNNFALARYTTSWQTYPASSTTATSLVAGGIAAPVDGTYQIGEPCPFPVITSVSPDDTLCVGDVINLNVTVAAPAGMSYQWYRNGIPLSATGTTSNYYLPGVTVNDAGTYRVEVTNACGKITVSDPIEITINPSQQVTATIISSTGNNSCDGSPVTFTAFIANGGTAPVVNWYVNGVLMQSGTSLEYVTNTLVSGDEVRATVRSNAPCAVPASVQTNAIVMTVHQVNNTSVTISSTAPLSMCEGTSVTFDALPVNGGTNPTYLWYVNGVRVGTSNSTFTTILPVGTNVTVQCRVVSSITCPSPDTASSNVLTYTVNPILIPSIAISADRTTICESDYITFTATTQNEGTNPTYTWNIGGTDYVTSVPTFTANTFVDGDNVICTMTSNAVCANPTSIASNTLTITVLPTPDASLTAVGSASVCQGDSVVLNASAGVGTAIGSGFTYELFRDNTSTGAASANAVFTVGVSGNYHVVVYNAEGCTDTSNTVAVTVNPLPVAAIDPSGTVAICNGTSIVLNAVNPAGMAFRWFRDGNFGTPLSTSSNYTASIAGSYVVEYTNSVTGCKDTSEATVVTVIDLATVTITPAGPIEFCEGGSITLTAAGANEYQWQRNGRDIDGARLATYTATTTGSYSVVAIGLGGCRVNSLPVVVTAHPYPAATITPIGSTNICTGQTVMLSANTGIGYAYQWYRNGDSILGATSINYIANSTAGYSVDVINPHGCITRSALTVVTVSDAPTAAINVIGNTTICQNETVELVANSGVGYTYRWFENGVAINPAVTTQSFVPAFSGVYSVEVSVGACSTLSTPVTITINAMPTAVITNTSGNTTICQGTPKVLRAPTGAGLTYQWYRDNTAIPGATQSTYDALLPGAYTVVLRNGNCSDSSASLVLTITNIDATITASGSTTICEGGSVTLYAPTGYGYQWQRNGVNIPGATYNSFAANTTGSYTVLVSNGTGSGACTTSSVGTNVTVNAVPVPIITVNGDQLSTADFYASYQWLRNGLPITNATSYIYNITQSGEYSVSVTDTAGCTATALPRWVTFTNVNDVTVDAIKVYPNPAQDVVIINAPIAINVTVLTIDGKQVLFKEKATSINIAELANGIYTLRITNTNNELLKIERLVKSSK